MHQLGQIIFEKFFATLLKERYEFPAVRGVGTHQSEIELDVAPVQRHAPESMPDGAVFFFRKGFRVDDVQDQVATGGLLVFLQEFQHPVGVALNAGQFHGQFLGEIEPQGHRFIEALENLSTTLGEGIEPLFREIEAGRPKRHVTQDVHREKQHHRDG